MTPCNWVRSFAWDALWLQSALWLAPLALLLARGHEDPSQSPLDLMVFGFTALFWIAPPLRFDLAGLRDRRPTGRCCAPIRCASPWSRSPSRRPASPSCSRATTSCRTRARNAWSRSRPSTLRCVTYHFAAQHLRRAEPVPGAQRQGGRRAARAASIACSRWASAARWSWWSKRSRKRLHSRSSGRVPGSTARGSPALRSCCASAPARWSPR